MGLELVSGNTGYKFEAQFSRNCLSLNILSKIFYFFFGKHDP